MLPSSLSAKRLAACSVLLNWKAEVRYTGTAQELVAESGL